MLHVLNIVLGCAFMLAAGWYVLRLTGKEMRLMRRRTGGARRNWSEEMIITLPLEPDASGFGTKESRERAFVAEQALSRAVERLDGMAYDGNAVGGNEMVLHIYGDALQLRQGELSALLDKACSEFTYRCRILPRTQRG